MMLAPFSADLNRAILELAPLFMVRNHAPQTWRDVQSSLLANSHIVVWAGEAHHSIYGDPAVNYAFRAWHDRCHLDGHLPFTIAGEEMAVARQCAELAQAYPGHPAIWADWIKADVLGVVYTLHSSETYVTDQRASVRNIVASGGIERLRPSREIARYAHGLEQ